MPTDKEERYEEALFRIYEWCDAYPIEAFPPLSTEEAARAMKILQDNGIRISALYGEWGRHITSAIKLICMDAKREEE